VALAFLAVYVPAYSLAYGPANFLFLCNISVILAVIGVWTCDRVLLSSQAVASLLVGALWTVDVASRLVLGRHLIGGTEYMWDPQWPLFTRLLSIYHTAMPVVLVCALRRIGYDSRGYCLQSALAIALVGVGRLFGPEANVNGSFFDPILKRSWGGAVAQVAVVAGALVLVVYPLSHLLLRGVCRRTASPRIAA
jgi:hypothetical protein